MNPNLLMFLTELVLAGILVFFGWLGKRRFRRRRDLQLADPNLDQGVRAYLEVHEPFSICYVLAFIITAFGALHGIDALAGKTETRSITDR